MARIDIRGDHVVDLSHAVEPGIPVPAGAPDPRFETFLSQERGDVANAEILRMGIHTGTHCDAPYHFFSHLRRIDELPADCLIGSAVVVDLTDKRGGVPILADDIKTWEQRSGETIRPDDIVLLHTGHSRHWKPGDSASIYGSSYPYLSRDAVDYLAAKPIRAVGVETFDPDWVNPQDLSSAEFPTHRTFLPKGIYIIENLTNLDQIPGTRCHLIALPLKLKGCSGSPVRVIAVT